VPSDRPIVPFYEDESAVIYCGEPMSRAASCRGGRCRHPHTIRTSVDLANVPCDPVGQQTLVLHTEAGPVPYCGIDNLRALRAADNLGARHIAAGVCVAYDVIEDEALTYTDERWALPQMVLAQALAEREERYCVADHLAERIAGQMKAGRCVGITRPSFAPVGPKCPQEEEV
jgi:hypothetical protein